MISHHLIIAAFYNVITFIFNSPLYVDEKVLERLFKDRSNVTYAIRHSTHHVKLTFGIELQQILEVNERSQFITTKVWVRQSWTNDMMSWNPKDWGGLTHLYTEPRNVWRPDIVLYNDADLNTFAGGLEKYKTFVIVYPNGLNVWNAPASFRSTCKMNVRYFPFDTQTCHMKFGSWAFDESMLRLKIHNASIITKQYLVSSTWDLIKTGVKFHSVNYECCEHPFHDITFTFVMKRRPLYYIVNIVAPCVVLVFMVLFSFLLPPSCRIRLSINITILLALTMFLHMLGGMLPQNADTTPVLSTFFITLMSECAFALIIMIIVRTIHNRGSEKGAAPPPKWAKKLFFEILSRYIGPKSKANRYLYEKDKIQMTFETDSCHRSMKLTRLFDKKVCQASKLNECENIIMYTSQDILKEVSKINKSASEREKIVQIEEEWKALSKIIDRLCFILCLMIFLLSALSTLFIVYTNEHYENIGVRTGKSAL